MEPLDAGPNNVVVEIDPLKEAVIVVRIDTRGIASYENDNATAASLATLGLSESQVDAMLESVVAGAAALDDMANQIAA